MHEVIIGLDSGLSPNRRQAIFQTNDDLLFNGYIGTTLNEISANMLTFSLKKMRLKMSSAESWSFCLGLHELS